MEMRFDCCVILLVELRRCAVIYLAHEEEVGVLLREIFETSRVEARLHLLDYFFAFSFEAT